jgi:hypothetical protein
MNLLRTVRLLVIASIAAAFGVSAAPASRGLRAGAATSNITPPLGTSINGSMQNRLADHVHDELHARALVIDDGTNRLAFVVNDSCMIPREVFDEAKRLAEQHTGIPAANMLMSATHTHSAPASGSVFQSNADLPYRDFLAVRIADAIRRANNNLAPARIGWGKGVVTNQVFNRRWFLKPGTPIKNPFGGDDQVKMNPGNQNPALDRPSGPVDPEVWFVTVQSPEGRHLALLADYSLHYVGGVNGISADYFGAFAARIGELLGASRQDPPFVGIMANGASGNINNINFAAAREKHGNYEKIQIVANDVAQEVARVLPGVKLHDRLTVAAVQREVRLGVRRPTAAEVVRAQEIAGRARNFPRMDTLDEIYARETLQMQDYPAEVSLVLQALRIGELAITAIPCEVFVEIGLELKQRNPFPASFTISLANGYNGYLPTPQHHAWGGYETWRAKSSYLEVEASDRITKELLEMLLELRR